MPADEPEMDVDMDIDQPEEESIQPSFEGEKAEETKEVEESKSVEAHLREYSEMVKASTDSGDDASAKSPVAAKGGSEPKAEGVDPTKGGEEKGGKAPAPKADTAKYQNRAGGSVKQSPAPKPKTSE